MCIFFGNTKKGKQNILNRIEKITAKINRNTVKPALYFERAKLYLQIKEPESALQDCINATRLDKKYIKKSKILCGKYHPILCEKYMSAVFYVINTGQAQPYNRKTYNKQEVDK